MTANASRGDLIKRTDEGSCLQETVEVVPPPLPPDCSSPQDLVRHADAPPQAQWHEPTDTGPSTTTACSPDCSSPQDLLRHAGALPQAQWHEPTDTGPSTTTACSPDQIQIDTNLSAFHVKEESTGWVSSVTLHAAIFLLLTMLLAPADFGGTDTNDLLVTLDHESELEQDVPLDTTFLATEEEFSQEVEVVPVKPTLVDVSLDGTLETAEPSEAPPRKEGGASGGKAATRGTFFGIEAYGHDFVYVLDMSGSMRGRRFSRATAELVRSVGELSENQNFYVLLFSNTTVQMFDQSDLQPTPIPATRENKERLSRWLRSSFRGGGTDPRRALVVSLRMRPSAIFMLSDGKFNGQAKQKNHHLFSGNSTAFSLVAAEAADVPIHAIAFENLQSCANMKRLAQMTKGQYRFAEADHGEKAKQSLAMARAAVDRGDNATGEILMRELIEVQGETETGRQAKESLANIFFQVGQKALNEDAFEKAKDSLVEIIRIDQQATTTAQIQTSLITELVQRLQQDSDQAKETKGVSMLVDVINQFPRSKAAKQLLDPVSKGLLDEARKTMASDPLRSIKNLELVLQRFPRTLAAAPSQVLRQQITDDLLSQAKQLRAAGDNVAAARLLREITMKFDGTHLDTLATREMKELASEMLASVRKADSQNDTPSIDEARRQLAEAFGNDATVQKMQRAFTQNEVKARDLLRRGDRMKKTGAMDNAVAKYKDIVKNYPHTVTADTARDRLRDMDRKRPVSADEALMLELMQQ